VTISKENYKKEMKSSTIEKDEAAGKDLKLA